MWTKPQVVTDVRMAFPGDVEGTLIPLPSEIRQVIPVQYWDFNGQHWYGMLFQDWFFKGLTKLVFTPKEGIDPALAYRHICAVMRSFQPKHEHKVAAVCWMFDNWFDKIEWEATGGV